MADQTLPGFTHKDEDADVNRFIKDQVDDLFDFMRDAEPEQKKAIARLLIGEVLRRFDAEFADGVAKLATN